MLTGDYKQRIWELPKELLAQTRLVWINSPHNPSGAVLNREDLRRTWETCREHDILLASDECYMDVYDLEPPPPSWRSRPKASSRCTASPSAPE